MLFRSFTYGRVSLLKATVPASRGATREPVLMMPDAHDARDAAFSCLCHAQGVMPGPHPGAEVTRRGTWACCPCCRRGTWVCCPYCRRGTSAWYLGMVPEYDAHVAGHAAGKYLGVVPGRAAGVMPAWYLGGAP